MTKKFVTFEPFVDAAPIRAVDNLLDTPVNPQSTFVCTKFVNRVAPQFTTATSFAVNSDSPFHRIRVWIRSLSTDYLLLEEEFPSGTTDFNIEFGGLFSIFNTLSTFEIVLFDKHDQRVNASLSYRDIHFPIIPHKRRPVKKVFMCVGPPCTYFKMLNRQLISVEGSVLVVEPDYTD